MSIVELILRLRALSPLYYTAVRCGHRTKRTGTVSAFGRTITTKMPRNDDGSVDYCLDCIRKLAIQCARCDEPIFIGDPITLSTPCDEFQIPEHAVVYKRDPLQLVGCLGWNCAETGADRAGFWMPGEDGKGCVERMLTAYEAILGVKGTAIPTLISLES